MSTDILIAADVVKLLDKYKDKKIRSHYQLEKVLQHSSNQVLEAEIIMSTDILIAADVVKLLDKYKD